jgi:hypothetical protein
MISGLYDIIFFSVRLIDLIFSSKGQISNVLEYEIAKWFLRSKVLSFSLRVTISFMCTIYGPRTILSIWGHKVRVKAYWSMI